MHHRLRRYRYRTEKEDLCFLARCNLKGVTCLDIGANRGIYSYWLSRAVGDQGRVYAFEPQPELQGELDQLIRRFKLHNVSRFELALSSAKGRLPLSRPGSMSGSASLDWSAEGWDRIEVPVSTVDDFLSETVARGQTTSENRISFIKCDVEGHEEAAFRGARKTLLKDAPVLLFECNRERAQQNSLFAFLESLDYEGFFFAKGQAYRHSLFDAVPYRKITESHRNYWFFHKLRRPDFFPAFDIRLHA